MSTKTTTTGNTEQREFSPVKKQLEAKDLLTRLSALLIDGSNPIGGFDEINTALDQTKNLTKEMMNQSHLNSEMSTILEDISELLFSARQIGKNKEFADQLQSIALDAQKALRTSHAVDISDTNKEATEFMNHWRPLFHLLMNSRLFRDLILDTIKITWKVVYLYEDLNINFDQTSPQSREEANADRIAKAMIEDIEVNGAPQMTDEEWHYLYKDVQKVWVLFAREPRFRQGVENIFKLLDIFKNSIDQNLPSGILSEEVHSNIEVTAEVPCFSGRKALEEFKYHLRQLIIKFDQNENFRGYLSELKQFILNPITEDVVYSKEFKQRSKELASNGRFLISKYEDDVHLKPFLYSAYDMIENIKNEEFLTLLRQHAGIVKSDISYVDSDHIVQVDNVLISKLQTVLLPAFTDALSNISLPRIHSNNDNREYWLDHILLSSHDIKPENIRCHLETEVTLSDIQLEGTHTYFVIELDHLLTEVKDVDFFYRKKTFPSETDTGRVTFRGKGEGGRLRITFNVVQDPEGKLLRIEEGFVSFQISAMDIEFDKSKMKQEVWIPRLTKIFQNQVVKQIESQVETNLNGFMFKLRDTLMKTITESKRPFISSIEAARQAVKSARVYDKRIVE